MRKAGACGTAAPGCMWHSRPRLCKPPQVARQGAQIVIPLGKTRVGGDEASPH